MKKDIVPVVIIGGGPAGLTAASELQKLSDTHVPQVYEASDMVGGISRTETHKGYRFDIGGHRFFNALSGTNDTASLIEEFQYPRLDPGMMRKPC